MGASKRRHMHKFITGNALPGYPISNQLPIWSRYFAPDEKVQVPAPWRGLFI